MILFTCVSFNPMVTRHKKKLSMVVQKCEINPGRREYDISFSMSQYYDIATLMSLYKNMDTLMLINCDMKTWKSINSDMDALM